MRIPKEMQIYFIAVTLLFVSFVGMYYEMIQMHEIAHQQAFSYFGVNSTIVFYSPFTAETIPVPTNISASDSRFLYFIQGLSEVFEYQFLVMMAFVFLAMLIIITMVFILLANQKRSNMEK